MVPIRDVVKIMEVVNTMIYSDLKDREAYRLLFPNYPDVLDIQQLCEILGIGIKTAYKLLRRGEIAHLKVGRAYRIPKCHVIAYLQKCGMPEKERGVSLETSGPLR